MVATPPPYIAEVPLQQQPITFEELPDDLALTIVRQQFNYAEMERTRNYDQKWNEVEALYEGVVPQKIWPGSESQQPGGVPRSSLPYNIAFDHVEGPIARIEAELFSNPEWFDLEARAGTTTQEAADQFAVIDRDLTAVNEETFCSGMEELRSGIRGSVTYGTTIGLIEFIGSRCYVEDLDLKNVFVDPAARRCGNIDSARFVIVRKPITAEEVSQMRENPDYAIPPDAMLQYLISMPDVTQSDSTIAATESIRGTIYNPGSSDVGPLPSLNNLVLYRYYSKKHIIYTLNNRVVIYKAKNPYPAGFYPLYSWVCREKKNRFYGGGYPEAIRWYQRAAEGIQNAHYDEYALAVNSAVTGPASASAQDLLIRPGRYATVENPAEVIRHEGTNVTQQAFAEIAQLVDQADRRNGMGMSAGSARPGQVRTKAGVDAQTHGADNRIAYVIRNITAGLRVMITKMRIMYRIHTSPEQILIQQREDDQNSRPITAAVFHREADVRVETAERMLTRDRLSTMIQPVLQTYLNPNYVENLASMGQTVNWDEIDTFIGDATGLKNKYQFVVPMSQEQQQARQQPPPQVVAQMQAKQGDQQIRREAAQLKHTSEMTRNQVELQKAQIAHQPDPMEAQNKQQESQIKMQEMMARLQFEGQRSQQQIEHERQMAIFKMLMEGNKLRMQEANNRQKMQQEQMKTEAGAMSHRIGLQQQVEEGDERRRQSMIEHAMKMSQAGKPEKPSAK